jgi:hypothetical protein
MKLHFRKVGVGPPVLVLRLLASLGQSAGGASAGCIPAKPLENSGKIVDEPKKRRWEQPRRTRTMRKRLGVCCCDLKTVHPPGERGNDLERIVPSGISRVLRFQQRNPG